MQKTIWPACAGESSQQEASDCTVRALANAAPMPYADAHALLSKHGRKFRHGATFTVYHAAYLEAGLTLHGIFGETRRAVFAGRHCGQTRMAGITLGRLLPRLRTGRWIVLITGHALAVVDGKVIDSGGSRAGSHVFSLYRAP